jgi:hypothetical protein
MGTAKDIKIAPISGKDANALVQRVHYSGKVAPNSQLHLGVFLNDRLEGAMQFGPSLDKRKTQALVSGTSWNGFLELNRMAFSEALPRNSESRALGVALRMIRKTYPHIEWILSFSDATQCGDGIIYRASGFHLCGIRENKTIWRFPDGEAIADIGIKTAFDWQQKKFGKILLGTEALKEAKRLGAKPIEGYQLRYIYFLKPEAKGRLTVPILPFNKIEQVGAKMYKGKRLTKANPEYPSGSGGAVPTQTLQS